MPKPDWLGRFRRDGFLPIGQILTEEEVNTVRAEYDRMFYSDEGTLIEGVRDLTERVGKPRQNTMLNREGLYREIPFFAELVRRPDLLDIAEAILEDDIRLFNDEGFWKPALYGGESVLHQDNTYWRLKPPNGLTVWIALDDASVDNGCLHYIPGSHHRGRVKHAHAFGGEGIVLEAKHDRASAVPVEVPAGHAIVHHALALHYAPPNRTAEHRRAYAIQYSGSRARPQRPEDLSRALPVLRSRGAGNQARDNIRRLGRQVSQFVTRLARQHRAPAP